MYSFIIEMKFSLKNVLQFQPLLKSQLVLYLFLFIALFEIVHFGTKQNVNGVLLLFLIGFLTSFFSKNMIVILFYSDYKNNKLLL